MKNGTVMVEERGIMMIYEDIYQTLMKNVSSKGFDILLYLSLHSNWDNCVKLNYHDIAKETKTTKKYVKEVVSKFKQHRNTVGKAVASETKKNNYIQLLIGKSKIFYSKRDRYIPHISLFYTKSFLELSIYEKRILLKGLKNVSELNTDTTAILANEFTTRQADGFSCVPSKKKLSECVNKINEIFKDSIVINSFIKNEKEYLLFKFSLDLLSDRKENHTEMKNLKELLFENGYVKELPSNHYQEILSVSKYIFNSFLKAGKSYIKKNDGPSYLASGTQDRLLELAREVYETSITRLSSQIDKNQFIEKESKELSAYFSSLVHTIVLEKATHFRERIIKRDSLASFVGKKEQLNQRNIIVKDILNERHKIDQELASILDLWCEEWVEIRTVKPIKEASNKVEFETIKKRTEKIKESISLSFNLMIDSIDDRNRGGYAYYRDLKLFLQDRKMYFIYLLDDVLEEKRGTLPFFA